MPNVRRPDTEVALFPAALLRLAVVVTVITGSGCGQRKMSATDGGTDRAIDRRPDSSSDRIDTSAEVAPNDGRDVGADTGGDRLDASTDGDGALAIDAIPDRTDGGGDGEAGTGINPLLDPKLLRQVAAGRHHTCAIRGKGEVWCWGGEEAAQLRPKLVDGLTEATVSVISGGDENTCALTDKLRVWCWADNGRPAAVAGLESVKQVAMGTGFACVLNTDGTIWCWGQNRDGQLGDGTTVSRTIFAKVAEIADGVEIGVGVSHACVRRADGTIWCWGDNAYWQLGDGTTIDRYGPVQVVGLPTVAQLAIGPRHSCARKNDGAVWCWGLNGAGEAGPSDNAYVTQPTEYAGFGPAADLTAGGFYSYGGYDNARTCVRRQDKSVWCAGRGFDGELGDGTIGQDSTSAPKAVPALGLTSLEIAIGGEHSCSRNADGSVSCWGRNYVGQLGRYAPYSSRPQMIAALPQANEIRMGRDSSCALTTTGVYMCWGDRAQAELGPKALTPAYAPQAVAGAPTNVKEWGVGGRYLCWLRTNGSVVCSGGKFGAQPAESTVLGTDNLHLAVGNGHACTIKSDGTLWCWGNTICGFTPLESEPTKQTLFVTSNVIPYAGLNLTCTQRTDGKVWCCGDGWGYAPIVAPVDVGALDVALSGNGCSVKMDGTVVCGKGLLTADPVDIAGVVQLALTRDAACARKGDGTVWCWGMNTRGILGVGTTPNSQPVVKPVMVTGLVNTVQSIAAGFDHICALDSAGRVLCWGDNYLGQLGDDTGGNRAQPAAVLFP